MDAVRPHVWALGIQIIPASSPQPKGRIERNLGTHQDRLVKKLRRKGIAEVEAANAFLDAELCADHNQRFAQAPASVSVILNPDAGLAGAAVFALTAARDSLDSG